MRIGLVVDSACDLPRDFLEENGVVLMPITLRFGKMLFEDRRDPQETQLFYASQLDRKSEDYAESIPYSPEQIEQLFLGRLVLDYDYVFCLTITATRSPIFLHAQQASHKIVGKYKEIRRAADLSDRFGVAVQSTRNLFTGQAVPVAEAARLIRLGGTPKDIGERVNQVIENTHTYMVPADLFHIYKRASKKGENTITWGSYTLGSWLDVKPILYCNRDTTSTVDKVRGFESGVEKLFSMAAKRIQAGLESPYVCLSYGGDPAAVKKLPGYAKLAEVAEDNGVRLLIAPMSTTAAVNVGPGALSLALAAKQSMH